MVGFIESKNATANIQETNIHETNIKETNIQKNNILEATHIEKNSMQKSEMNINNDIRSNYELERTDDTNISLEELNETPEEQLSQKDAYTIINHSRRSLEQDNNNIFQGGAKQTDKTDTDKTDTDIDIIYEIDYILDDDSKLINADNVKKAVDLYINNYNSKEMETYREEHNKIYQRYSNKNYKITIEKAQRQLSHIKSSTPSKIVVQKTDKTNKIVSQLNKPQYIFYNENNLLYDLKTNISNTRTELLYKYENLISKLIVTIDEKKAFENERNDFISLLEEYYTYMLYHKKINKINLTNKDSMLLQKQDIFYNIDTEDIALTGDIYSVDKLYIDTLNKMNTENLVDYNNIILSLSGVLDKHNKIKDKKTILKHKQRTDTIKEYLKKKTETHKIEEKLHISITNQNKYVNYIIAVLPL